MKADDVELRATLIITTAALGIAIAQLQMHAPHNIELAFLKQKLTRANKALGIVTETSAT